MRAVDSHGRPGMSSTFAGYARARGHLRRRRCGHTWTTAAGPDAVYLADRKGCLVLLSFRGWWTRRRVLKKKKRKRERFVCLFFYTHYRYCQFFYGRRLHTTTIMRRVRPLRGQCFFFRSFLFRYFDSAAAAVYLKPNSRENGIVAV